jgi:GNAT superfamily N-acetyltransferase
MSEASSPVVGRTAVRPSGPQDVPAIARMVRELADYEHALDQVELTEAGLAAALFGPAPTAAAHVAEHEGAVAGFALWFVNFSTWTGAGMYLEDLYVSPAARGTGLGRALLAELAAVCVRRGYARLQWAVLDWNEPALRFYAAIGAQAADDWRIRRLSGVALRDLAGPAAAG